MIQQIRRIPPLLSYLLLCAILLFGPLANRSHAEGPSSVNLLSHIEGVDDSEIEQLESTIRESVEKLKRLGATEVYLGGGTARALLDHLYRQRPITMSDLDLVAVVPGVTEERAAGIGATLAAASTQGLRFLVSRPAPRGNPALPIPERYQYVPTYYVGLRSPTRFPVWDLALYRDPKEILLSGILSSDMIRVPVDRQSLKELLSKAKSRTYEQLVAEGSIVDPHGGYRSWLDGELRVINWTDVEGDPALMAVRLLRMYRRVGQDDWPPELKEKLKKWIQGQAQLNRLPGDEEFGKQRVPRAIQKILKEPDADLVLLRLSEIGTIAKWSPALQERLLKMTAEQRAQLTQHGPEKAWDQLQAVASEPDCTCPPLARLAQ